MLLRLSGADTKEIEKLVRQSIAANPSSVNARLALINFYVRGRDFKTALTTAQEAHAALPNEPRTAFDPLVPTLVWLAILAAVGVLTAVGWLMVRSCRWIPGSSTQTRKPPTDCQQSTAYQLR